jgi:hypothetical protein
MLRSTMASILVATVLAAALLVALAAPASAKKNDPNVELDFRPQQAVGGAEVQITPNMLRTPVSVTVEDLRPGDDPADIGTRTDNDDRKHTLRAVDKVQPYLASVVEELLHEWGIQTQDDASLSLNVILVRFSVLETNRAVGATYEANVQISAELTGSAEWSGGASGDATRYGKKFSNDNVNEVLSDAVLEALASLLSNPGLHEAWGQ